jgi:hypothetical protein
VARCRELAARGVQKGLADRFEFLIVEEGCYAYEGPFDELLTGDAVPTPDLVALAFKDAGFNVRLAIPQRPESALADGYKKVWLIDKWNQKRPLLSKRETQQLYVKPPTNA